MTTSLKVVGLYTDGACQPNPGQGGWAAILRYAHPSRGMFERITYGSALSTTNNQMEMTAAIKGLKLLKEPCGVMLHTDSKYLISGCQKWVPNWKKNGWRTKTGDVKNKDLWMELDSLMSVHQITFRWVKGHSGHKLNERADQLAVQARLSQGDDYVGEINCAQAQLGA